VISNHLVLIFSTIAALGGTASAQLIDTAPTPDATTVSGSDRGASVKIETATQVFITRLDAEIQPQLLGTNVKFVIWNATTGKVIHETSSQATILAGRHFLKSPALAFNTAPGGQYVLALMAEGNIQWFVDRNKTENQNSIKTLAKGGVQTTFDNPNEPPKQDQNFDARMLVHGFILNDNDNDTVNNEVDNCPFNSNTNQADSDGDGLGDACDSTTNDEDGDTIVNASDNCPFIDNPGQEDTDGDGIGDACDKQNDTDLDEDGTGNTTDNCPFVENPDQADSDADGVGDACDTGNGAPDGDADGDGVPNNMDNCSLATNPDQTDGDGDGLGDACDLTIIVDGGGCSTGGGDASLFGVLLGIALVVIRRRRSH
jgi:MYXO-CTERM domain-containing protein